MRLTRRELDLVGACLAALQQARTDEQRQRASDEARVLAAEIRVPGRAFPAHVKAERCE